MKPSVFTYILLASLLGLAALTSSCDDKKSYAEMLSDETKAANLFLSNQRVVSGVPADTVFEVGEDAPYYCLDPQKDKTVYMQVLTLGDRQEIPQDTRVYFRYTRFNLFLYKGPDTDITGNGNADSMAQASSYFIFGDLANSQSSDWGEGIQMPLRYGLGYNATVRLLIKSQSGFSSEIAQVTPFIYTVTYFKSQI